jgi:hypothetical protein
MSQSSKHTPVQAAEPRAAVEAERTTTEQPDQAQQPEDAQQDEPEQAVVTQPGVILGPINAAQQAQSGPKREETESAFDKTQRILNRLMGIEPEEEPEPAPSSESPDLEQAPDDAPAQVPAETPVAATAESLPQAADAVQPVRGGEMGVSLSEFTKLSSEVTQLQRELRKLREELQSLRAQEPVQAVAVPASVDVGSDSAGQAENARDSLQGSPVEDVA